jgi:Ser/Thr protein kinase RdoA (MazF antagonist)
MATSIEVGYSTATVSSVLRLVQAEYDLPAPLTGSLLRRGFNDHYAVDAGGTRYLFRLYLRQKYWLSGMEELQWEVDLLEHLRRDGIPVSHPLPRRNGEFLGAVEAPEGLRHFALLSWAPGQPPAPYTPDQARALGETVAGLHQSADRFTSARPRFELSFGYLVDGPLERYRRYMTDADYKAMAAVAQRVKERLSRLTFPADGWGIIHGDLHGGNCHFDAAGGVTLFDFDICGYGWRAYDLAAFTLFTRRASENVRTAFLDGYQSVRPLSEAEHQAIPTLIKARAIWDTGDFLGMADIWGDGFMTEQRAKTLLKDLADLEEKFPG